MSLQVEIAFSVPPETARVAKAAFPKGNVYMTLRDQLGTLYEDPQFAALFPPQGQPAQAPWRLALVTLMQFAENLPDRQAADAVRSRIDWKYALGVELTDPGFDFSVLSEFRARLVAGNAEHLLLDTVLALGRERGWLKARGRQRTDSTHVLAAIHTLNRLEKVGETLRHTLNVLAEADPQWLRAHLQPEWADRYGKRFDNYRLPRDKADREALAVTVGQDGRALLWALWAADAPEALRHLAAVSTLRQVWVQQFVIQGDQIDQIIDQISDASARQSTDASARQSADASARQSADASARQSADASAHPVGRFRWRDTQDLPPAALRLDSPYDPEARYSLKRETVWSGYKVHVTETCDADMPSLITHVQTTPATTQDSDVVPALHADLAQAGLLPGEHLADAGYVNGPLLAQSRRQYGVEMIGPVARDGSWQAAAGQGYDTGSFLVDWAAQQATCPQGKASCYWQPQTDGAGNAVIHVQFSRTDCKACATLSFCTHSRAGRRELHIRPQAEYLALQEARSRQKSAEFQTRYRARAGIEGTLSRGIATSGLRRARYVGEAKTHLQHVATATALNVLRMVSWLTDAPRATPRQSRFAALCQAT